MRINIILVLLCFFSLYGCYEDKGNYDYKDLNTIRITEVFTNQRDYKEGYVVGSLVKISPKLEFALDSLNVRLGFKWMLCGREIGHSRDLEWVADTAGIFSGRSFYLQIRDSTSGLEYMSGLYSSEENIYMSLNIRSTSLAGGWLVVSKKEGQSVISYAKMEEKYDPSAGEYYWVSKIIEDVYADRNDGERLGGDVEAIECTWIQSRGINRTPCQVLIVQNGGIGPVYVDGGTFQKSVLLKDEFVNGQLPAGVKFVNAFDKPAGSVLITDKGLVYMRRKDDPQAYFTGRYPDYTVMIEKGMNINKLASNRYDALVELAFDKKNNRFLMMLDRFDYRNDSDGGVFSPVYQAENTEGYTLLNQMGDVEMVYFGGYKEGEELGYLTLFKNNNAGKDGKYYVSKFVYYQNYVTGLYEVIPLAEKVFPDQHLINGQNIFAISQNMKQYLLFSAGEQQDKLYGYMYAGEEGGVANSRLLYDFKGRSIKSIIVTGTSGHGVFIGIALGNGEICKTVISADAFISGVKEEAIDYYPANFGDVQFMVYLETQAN